jgi:hypothetical protein
VIKLCISNVNGSLLLGTVSLRFFSSRTLAISGARRVSAVERKRRSKSRNCQINLETSSK